MLNAQDAWSRLSKKYPNLAIETASEIDNFFIFSTRPKDSDFGVATGTTCYFVDKKTGEVTARSIFDSSINESKTYQDLDPITLNKR